MSLEIHLVRHGQTDWNITGQHTGRTDLPLNDRGREESRAVRPKLLDRYDRVFVSPLRRALETCELAGHAASAEPWDDLMEWNYGAWEGLTKAQIAERTPGWDLWRDGSPDGEDIATMTARMDRVVARLAAIEGGRIAVFAHGHVLRCLSCRWVGWPIANGKSLALGNCAVVVLVREDDEPQIKTWNA